MMRGFASTLAVLALLPCTARMASAQAGAEHASTHEPRFFYTEGRPGAKRIPVEAAQMPVLRRRIAVDLEGLSLAAALGRIADQAGLRLVYPNGIVPGHASVHLEAADITVAGALAEVLRDTGIDVVLSADRQAVLVRRDAEQSGTIVGLVTDAETAEPVVAVAVTVGGTGLGATTGDSGRYRIANVPPGTYTLTARRIGYAKSTRSVTVVADQEATLDIALTKSANKLDQVIVTGTVVPTEVRAVPTPVTVITAQDIAAQHPRTVQQVLRQAVPTMVSWDLPSLPVQTVFSARGATSLTGGGGQMKVYLDGVEMSAFTTAPVDPASIERIEVIRGPEAAAIYGSDAIDGVIQIFTKRGGAGLGRPTIDAQAALGSMQTPYDGFNNVLRQAYSASVRGGAADASYSLGGGYSHLANYVPHGEISRQSNPSVYGSAHVDHGIVSFDVSGRYYEQDNPQVTSPKVLDLGFPPLSKPNFEPTRFLNQTVGVRIGVAPTKAWHSMLTLGVDRASSDMAQVRPHLTNPADTLLLVLNTAATKQSVGFNTSLAGALGRGLTGQVTAGIDHYRLPATSFFALGADTSGTLQNVSATRSITTNTGYFVQGQLGIHDALFLTAGVRAEHNTNFGDSLGTPVSPRFGFSYVRQVSDVTLKTRASWGRALRAPGPEEKAESFAGGLHTLPNATLGPERQRGWDAGVDAVFGNRGSLSVTYYDQTAEHLIENVIVAFTPVLTAQWQNVGRVTNSGFEVEGMLDVGQVRLKGQYGYTRARIDALGAQYAGDLQVGDQVAGTPKHTAGASLIFAPTAKTTVSAGLTYVGSWTAYDELAVYGCLSGTASCPPSFVNTGSTRDFIVPYPSFVKLNLSVSQQIAPHLSAFVSVDNLTNNQSTEMFNFMPVVGRITMAGLQLHY